MDSVPASEGAHAGGVGVQLARLRHDGDLLAGERGVHRAVDVAADRREAALDGGELKAVGRPLDERQAQPPA